MDAVKQRAKDGLQKRIDRLRADASKLEIAGKEFMEFKMREVTVYRERAAKLEKLMAEMDRMTAEGAEGVLEALLP